MAILDNFLVETLIAILILVYFGAFPKVSHFLKRLLGN
jgi:hypothetical protein